ncbi:DUF2802 domain-containing protein [Marinibactrum halimedae]|uniref:DUF2802 domain-containing protein n=1 Tax=Marinibactrum halimedae TaxID=1444977 RepID=A0AA37T4J0_9GAMM|nr:DUF2802 domain-containing protein [Marinibactrum halimedae]MCD9459814.1 DUF2802 domain-containing protein [Marinibactrum halimedae]GLS26993.1 hypothetical protein GCM10007877_27120 [Marinibactrum halimedae]
MLTLAEFAQPESVAMAVVVSWLALALVLAGFYMLYQQHRATVKAYRRLQLEIDAINTNAVGVGRKVVSVEQKVASALLSLRSSAPQTSSHSDGRYKSNEAQTVNQQSSISNAINSYSTGSQLTHPSHPQSISRQSTNRQSTNQQPGNSQRASEIRPEPSHSEAASSGAYGMASRLLTQGVGVNEVARRCGLSVAEANIMRLVHQRSAG